MTAAILGVQWAQLHSRPLQAFLLHNWDSRKSSLNWLIQLPKGFFQSVLVEATGTSAREGRTWYSPMKITTDASLWGWGAHSGDWQAQGGGMPVIKFQRTCSSGECFNCSGGEGQFKRPVDFFSDNATTVAYLNKQGGTRSDTLLLLSQQILSWAENNVSSVRAVHISGTVNVLVDYLSRVNISASSWELKTRSRRSC